MKTLQAIKGLTRKGKRTNKSIRKGRKIQNVNKQIKTSRN